MPIGFAFDEDDLKMDMEIAIGDTIAEMAQEIADEIVKLLVQEDHVVTAQLAKTVFWEIDPETPMSFFVGTEAPYALHAEWGIRATQVPFPKIQKWVQQKFGLLGKERDDIAWAIVKKIAKDGLKGIRFTYRATDKVVREWGGSQ